MCNFVLKGKWVSNQTVGNGNIRKYFKDQFEYSTFITNKFPSKLDFDFKERPDLFPLNALGDFCPIVPRKVHLFLDEDFEGKTVIVIGPSGSGKTLFINSLFNRQVLDPKNGKQEEIGLMIFFFLCSFKR